MAEQVDAKTETRERLSVLRKLIREGEASTQEELVEALKKKKFDVTQSTVSRDLRRIGALKTTNSEDEVIYVLPEDHQVGPKIDHDLSPLVLDIEANETMIVIHTAPGAAGYVARYIDNVKSSLCVLGTIAGDDTIFVVPETVKKINQVIKNIKEEF